MRGDLLKAVAASAALTLLPGAPGVVGHAAAAPDQSERPFEVDAKDRRAAGREAERGAGKMRDGDARAALKHYLAALRLDPYNAAGRAGLAALVGPIGTCDAPSPAAVTLEPAGARVSAPEREAEAGRRSAAPGGRSFLGRFPGLAQGAIRTTGPSYRRAEPYLPVVQRSAERYGVEPRLILGVIRVESNFEPKARSSSGARGLMQLLPETGRRFGARSLDDPAQNVDAGTRYLRYLLELFRGDVDRALAGYTAGEMSVVRAGGVPRTASVKSFIRAVKDASGEF